MTCILPRPSPQALFDRVLRAFQANVLGGRAIVPNSAEQYVVGNEYLLVEQAYSTYQQAFRETDPRTACCDNLEVMARRRGVPRRAAVPARGYVTLTGTVGASIPTDLQFRFGEQTYQIDAGATVPTLVPASGSVVVRVVALVPGSAGNALSSTTGTLVTPATGINSAVTSCGASFCNGRDEETCEQHRSRYLERLRFKPAGDFGHIVEMIKEWPCVTRVCIRNCTCCTEMYRFELYPFFDGTFPHGIPPQNVVNDLQTWFFGETQGLGLGRAPAGIRGQFFIPTPAAVNVHVDDLNCQTTEQIQLITERMEQLFTRLCPSDRLCLRQFDQVVTQVMGTACTFSLSLTAEGAGLTLDPCGDIVPDCDILPVLGEVIAPPRAC